MISINWKDLGTKALHGAWIGLAAAAVVDWNDLKRFYKEQGFSGIKAFFAHFAWKVAARKYALGLVGGAAAAIGLDKFLPWLGLGGVVQSIGAFHFLIGG